VPLEERGQFATAALELQRERRSRGIEAFHLPTHLPPPKYTKDEGASEATWSSELAPGGRAASGPPGLAKLIIDPLCSLAWKGGRKQNF
jgi:hypothetical protein